MATGAGSVLRDLHKRLTIDSWRNANPFSDDVALVHKVLFHPYSTIADCTDALESWLHRCQPCLFGKIAAAGGLMHFCFVTDEDLVLGDEHLEQRIRSELVAWKRRSAYPHGSVSTPAHGFMLIITSPRVAFARPDDALKRFADELLRVWNCACTNEQQGVVHWEKLFLWHPQEKCFFRFTFSVDFFASAGDRRWWHDHRVPGGIAFTANSAGHMRRYREWYKGKDDQRQWVLENAMGTIALAAKTPYGQATWLRPLADGKPLVADVACPFSNAAKIKPELRDKDWTRYGGHLHTDQAVREVFFREEPGKSNEIEREEWVQDFVYIFDRQTRDHIRFIEGERVSAEEVNAEIGRPDEYVKIVGPARRPPERTIAQTTGLVPDAELEEIAQLLDQCRAWRLSEQEIREID